MNAPTTNRRDFIVRTAAATAALAAASPLTTLAADAAGGHLGELYLELKQPAKAEERLTVLQKACGDCEEYQELKEKNPQQAAN